MSHGMTLALSTTTEQKEKATVLCRGEEAGAGKLVPFECLPSQFGGAPWAWPWASQMWPMLWQLHWVPETPPNPGLHCAPLSLPSPHVPRSPRGPSITGQTHVPQVMDMLQEMLTTICSLKTTVEGFQEELQLLKDNFQKVHA